VSVGIFISQEHGLVCISDGYLAAFAIIKSSFLSDLDLSTTQP